MSLLMPSIRRHKLRMLVVLIGLLMVSGGTAASAYLIKPVLDQIFVEKNITQLYYLPVFIIMAYILQGAGRFIQIYYGGYIGNDAVRTIRENLLERLVRLQLDFFHKNTTGELISRITFDTSKMQDIISHAYPVMAREFVTAIGLLAVTIYQGQDLAFYALVVMPLAVAPLSFLAEKMRKLSHTSQEKVSDLTTRLSEIFNNIEIIKSNGGEQHELDRFATDNELFFRVTMRGIRTHEMVLPLMETLGAVGVCIVVITGGSRVIDGTMSMGTFFSFITALFMLYTPLKSFSTQWNKLQEGAASAERVYRLLTIDPEHPGGDQELSGDIKSIALKGVHLSYGETKALSGITMSIKEGESIALVGNSGGGKSSLVNLLVRFFDPNEGIVTINDVPLRDYKLSSLRSSIAMVSQRVFIFYDTVAANVAYGLPIEEEKVIDALKKSHAWEFVSELKHGIHSLLGEFGANLSGGQRQRISIARAIYRNPKLLILDEATSALDNQSESLVQEALEKLAKGRMTITVAHRLSTIKNCNRIAVFKEGELLAFDSEAKLLAECEEYKKLYSTGVLT